MGRSWANDLARFRKIPTDTGSTCTGPRLFTWCITASKIGRSCGGPVEKYSSSDIAGAHSCDCPARANRRPHAGQFHPGTPAMLAFRLWRWPAWLHCPGWRRILQAIVAALAEQQAELSGLLSGLDDTDWLRPSRCEGWTVSDVVLHLAQTNELATASASRRMAEALAELGGTPGGRGGTVDDGADLLVARERGRPGPAVRERWTTSGEVLCRRLEDADPHQRLDWVAGQLSARSLAATRIAETWIHAGDVGEPFAWVPAATDRLWHVARLAWRTLPYAFARAGRELS
ncbi:MAG: maleylpyruvate isomerase family mycothiol-dependent enzyme, partial [Actinobacteria bacterium]